MTIMIMPSKKYYIKVGLRQTIFDNCFFDMALFSDGCLFSVWLFLEMRSCYQAAIDLKELEENGKQSGDLLKEGPQKVRMECKNKKEIIICSNKPVAS